MHQSRAELLSAVMAETARHSRSAGRFNVAMGAQLSMPPSELQCLGLLGEGPATPTALADQLGLTTGAMTKVLDRLQAEGYVTRSRHPGDRRRVVIHVVAERFEDLARHYQPMAQRMEALLQQFSDRELHTVLRFMRASREAADAEIALIRDSGHTHMARRRPP
jgi:DNA-binding MarR family transcriptional regulator